MSHSLNIFLQVSDRFPSWKLAPSQISLKTSRGPEITFTLEGIQAEAEKAEELKTCFSGSFNATIEQLDGTAVCNITPDRSWLTKKVLEETESVLFKDSILFSNIEKQVVVIDYSSPNIAKPFHVGHLRSSIIGNFLKNLLKTVGHQTVGLNYLGDWGTQFGILKHGLDQNWISANEIHASPIRKLFEVYVKANTCAKDDPVFFQKSLEKFRLLENADENTLRDWSLVKNYTVAELTRIYARLNIEFDVYDWESMYEAEQIRSVISLLEREKLTEKALDGKTVYRLDNTAVTLLKSDGTTLYLTRDIAAALDRRRRFKANRFLYVVDNAQSDHFRALFAIMRDLDMEGADGMQHVKFGRIQGMSTRKGNVVFLEDVLDEAKERMAEQRKRSETTRMTKDEDSVNDALGISAVVINDLKQRRQKDYVFSWEKVLASQGDTGVKLQYCHSRLCSLKKNCGIPEVPPASEVGADLLSEPEAINLIRHLMRFEEILIKCHDELEPCILVAYLFQLCNSVSVALKRLKVKDQPSETAEARLALFMCARNVLKKGIEILGLKPLEEM